MLRIKDEGRLMKIVERKVGSTEEQQVRVEIGRGGGVHTADISEAWLRRWSRAAGLCKG
jgi:hypothetical protein